MLASKDFRKEVRGVREVTPVAEGIIPMNQAYPVLLGETSFIDSSTLPITINAPGVTSSGLVLITLTVKDETVTEVVLPIYKYLPMFVYESDNQKAYCIIENINTDTPSVKYFNSDSTAWKSVVTKTVRIYRIC